jgi:8-oxo-dGTP diphosphatase
MDKSLVLVGTNVLCVRGGKVLLLRRANTGWQDGKLCIPGGHAFERETPLMAGVREIAEELGLNIVPERLEFVCIAARNSQPKEFASYEFAVELADNEQPVNTEPDKCSELVWADPHELPDDVIKDFRDIITKSYLGGQKYI